MSTTSTRFSFTRNLVLVSAVGALAFAALPAGCSGATARDEFDNEEAGASGGPGGPPLRPDSGPGIEVDGNAGCLSLQCQVVACDSGPSTTVTGTVYDPAGNIPLYNAIVYVPVYPDLPDTTPGATCDRCGTLTVKTVTSALSDTKGEFKLENVPVGDDIPIVVQVGKWRKVVKMKVEACVVNKLDAKLTLPKNQQEGSMPRIAVSTGGEDALACLLNRIGIDDEEFTAPGGTGAVHVYEGGGLGISTKVQGDDAPKAKDALWDSIDHLLQYDVVLMSCEGAEENGQKPADAKERMRDYLNAGGRMFATHYHYTWFKNGPDDVRTVAEWGGTGPASDTTAGFTIDRSFPKGEAFGDWLQNNGASANGQSIDLTEFAASIEAANGNSQQWIYGDESNPVKYLSFNTPVGLPVEQQCGRGVLSDIHVGEGRDSNVPSACSSAPLTDQEKALLFLLMDLSSCVQDDNVVPEPPN